MLLSWLCMEHDERIHMHRLIYYNSIRPATQLMVIYWAVFIIGILFSTCSSIKSVKIKKNLNRFPFQKSDFGIILSVSWPQFELKLCPKKHVCCCSVIKAGCLENSNKIWAVCLRLLSARSKNSHWGEPDFIHMQHAVLVSLLYGVVHITINPLRNHSRKLRNKYSDFRLKTFFSYDIKQNDQGYFFIWFRYWNQ